MTKEIKVEDILKSVIVENPFEGSNPCVPNSNVPSDKGSNPDAPSIVINESSGETTPNVKKELKGYTKEQIRTGISKNDLFWPGRPGIKFKKQLLTELQELINNRNSEEQKKIIERLKDTMGEPEDKRATKRDKNEEKKKDNTKAAPHEHIEYVTKRELQEEVEKYIPSPKTIVINKEKDIKVEFGDDDYVHGSFDKVLQLAGARKNILLKGPAGCGKTYMVGQVARALGLPFYHISCSMGMSESQLAGWLLPIGEAGKFEYTPAPFVTCYDENGKGGVFLLDEFDNADPNLAVFFNTAIANGEISIPQNIGRPVIKKHKDCIIIAACNTFGNGPDAMYVGRNQLDAATLDRFRCGIVEMDYDPKLESAIVDKEVLAWGVSIRDKIRSSRLRRIMSTRFLKDMTDMKLAYKWKKKDWKEVYFADWTEDERKKVAA